MVAVIRRLGMAEEELAALGPVDGKRKKKFRQALLEMYQTPLPSSVEIKNLEAIFGEFPEDYKEFLLRFNGGTPVPNIIITKNNERVVNFFFPIKYPPGYSENFHAYCETYRDRIPSGMLPIASAGGGDLVLIQLGGPNHGKVYYWDHNFESEGNASNYYENVELIANSFNLLLDSFCDIDDPEDDDID